MGDVDTAHRDTTARAREADAPRNSLVARFGADRPLKLDAGVELSPFQIAYQTYGTLNADRSNAVLVCHALTGDQHVANVQSGDRQARLVGDHGRPRQADRHRALLRHLPERARRLHGLDRPGLDQSRRPASRGAWNFPVITIRDMVRAQAMLLDRARASTRCSRSPAARWAACRCCNGPRAIRSACSAALPIACATRHSAQNIAFHEVGRQAVMADPEWKHGRYFAEGTSPRRGLAVARMGAHITYLSDAALHRKFGRKFQDRENPTFSFDADFEVESPICATRARRSSSGSTPTPISI